MNNICVGSAQFGMNYGISNQVGQVDFQDVLSIVNCAHNNEVYYYDTAQVYGNSEKVLGHAFRNLGVNDTVKCITKIRPYYNINCYKDIRISLLESIQRLNIESLWGLLIHRVDQFDSLNKHINALKTEQIISNFGVSVYYPDDALKFLEVDEVDFLQIPFNAMDRRLVDLDFFIKAKKYGKKIFIRSLFLQGLFFLSNDKIIEKDLGWMIPELNQFHLFWEKYSQSNKDFLFEVVKFIAPNAVLVVGNDSLEQFQNNLISNNSKSYGDKLLSNWWDEIPKFSDRILNPSKW